MYADGHSSRVMLSRAEIIKTREDEDDLALVDVYGHDGEILKKVHRLQSFGDAYRPPAGAHGTLMSLGGRRDQAIFFGGEQADKRPRDLGVGERCLYNAYGDKIYIHKEKIKTTTKEWIVEADTVKIKGAVTIEGNITHTGNMVTSGTHVDSVGVHV
jgi:phage baseplate assembly protein V